MKRVIRYGVFETNSSSTHSMTYSKTPPKEYTFECASPWSRLVVLKALTNVGVETDLREEETFAINPDHDEEFEEEYQETSDEEAEEDEGAEKQEISEDESEEEEDYDYEYHDSPTSDILKSFYERCAEIYCEREGINKKDLAEHLGELTAKNLLNLKNVKRYVGYFKQCYDGRDCDLCDCLFAEGTLDDCTCGFDYARSVLWNIFDGADYLFLSDFTEKATEYLYGEKRFFATEHYSGFITYNDKKKV